MFENMGNLKIVNVIHGVANQNSRFADRPFHGLVFKKSGSSMHYFEGKKFSFTQGDVLFIPQGADYWVSRNAGESSRYTVINFTAQFRAAEPCMYHPGNFAEIEHLLDRLMNALVFSDLAGQYESISLFYRILSLLYQSGRKEYCSEEKRARIRPAMEYLEKHIFSKTLKIGELHELCDVSDTYFRRIFVSEFGVSPKKYVLDKRLIQAQNILESREFDYVYEVAAAVGFEDPLYFGKCFRERYGCFPSEYKREGQRSGD